MSVAVPALAPVSVELPATRTRVWATTDLLAITPLLLLGWLLRSWHLAFYDLRGDEVFGVGFAMQPLGQMFPALASGEPHPPLFYSLLRLWMPLAGDGGYALRWLSAAGGVLGIAVVYVLGRRVAGRAVGLTAALFMALAPYQVWNAQDARMYTLATAFSGAAVYWCWRLMIADRPLRRTVALAALSLLLALYTHYYSIYVAALLNVVAIAVFAAAWRRDGWRKLRQRLGDWAFTQLVVAALYLPWLAYAWRTVTAYHGNAFSPDALDAIRQCLTTFALGWDLPTTIADPLLPLYGAALVLGLVCATRLPQSWRVALLLVCWLVVPVGAIWLAARERPIFDVRYLIEASPPFYLLLALPARWLSRPPAWRGTAAAFALTLLLVPLPLALDALYLHPSDGRGHGFAALASFLAAHVGDDDVIVVNNLDPVVRYYARHAGVGVPVIAAPSRQDLGPEALNTELSTVSRGREHVWLVPDDAHAWDRTGAVLAWLDRHAERLAQFSNGYDLIEYQTLAPAHATDITFGNVLTLIGYSLAPDGPTSGTPWQVTLFWRAAAPMPADKTVSVQLLDASGRLVAQQDAPPQSGRAPTQSWQPFETIPDTHTLALPSNLPAGRYTIGVAVYPSAGGPRLSVPDVPSGLAPLTSVEVR